MTLPYRHVLDQLLIIAGPTASGKSALALRVAQQLQEEGLPVEIISVDSALVYRGMDIGTAKPSQQERQSTPHHLIDILAPEQTYSAADFVTDTVRIVQQVRGRGAFPLLAGGTMLYVHALLQGLDALPKAHADIRAEIEALARMRGWPAMHAWLQQVDAATAARLSPNDSQRIGRALEVWRATGQPMSALLTQHAQDDGWQADWMRRHLYSLEPQERQWLHARIALRFAQMMEQGFLDEVRQLRSNPALHAQLPSMRSVGYRQAWQMLDGEFGLDDMRERAIAATRQLAKRQITWLRSMKTRHVLQADAPDGALHQHVQQVVRAALEIAGRH